MSTNLGDDRAEHLERLDPADRVDHQAAQHWSRYDWASGFLPARRVLDCACGLGYGSALLAERGAGEVVGIDVSADAIASASRRYARPGVAFLEADALALDPGRLGVFDLIVSLETIEHVPEPARLLDVFRSLLSSDGFVLVSCPNEPARERSNPYHAWRATYEDLVTLLAARFRCVSSYAEVHTYGSAIWPVQIVESGDRSPQRYSTSTRLVDVISARSAAGFLFACGDRTPPSVAPNCADLLDGSAYVRDLERVRDDLWGEARRLGRTWEDQRLRIEEQSRRIGELEQVVDDAQREGQRVAGAWTLQNERIQELEAEKSRLWAEAQRLGEAWNTQSAYIRGLESRLEAAREAAERASTRRTWYARLLQKLNRGPTAGARGGDDQ